MSEPKASDMVIEGPRRSFWRNLSVVWLVPLLALAVSLFVAWRSFAERGQLITIRFENAAGIVAEDTTLRYRDVVVGVVESVAFAPDLTSVLVRARVDRNVTDSLPQEAAFWVVRPEVSATRITGLSTVLSGVYIQMAFEPQPGSSATVFTGLDKTPLVEPGEAGTEITLRASTGSSLTAGAPIFHKGIEVGRIEEPRLLASGDGVIVDAFIDAPHDKLLTSATRFWQTSGISVNIGTGGVNLSIGSLASLVRGGLTFDTVFQGGAPIRPEDVFDLYKDEDSARESVFSDTVDNAVDLAVEFEESVNGLSSGAQVMYKGVRVGTVSSLGAIIEETPEGPTVKLRATVSIDPQRLGLPEDTEPEGVIEFVETAVEGGLRARLASQSIFSQSLVVELAEVPDAEPAALLRRGEDLPLIPAVPSDLPDVAARAEGLLNRVDNLPIEELLEQGIATLASIENLAGDEKLRAAPDAFVSLMDDARGLIGGEETQKLPGEINAAIADLRSVVERLVTADAVGKLTAALDAAGEAAESVTGVAGDVGDATAQLPQLVDDLRALTAKANSLEVEDFLAAASAFLEGADRLIDTPAARALPGSLTGALDEARNALAELRAGGVVENTNQTLASARDAAAAVQEAAESLPDLSARIQRLVGEAERVVTSYDSQSTFNRETVSALREVRAAAEALSKLARAIERNPNSLLFGR
ncbi:paraquat-inducible protein B [Primorskyibacter flagellatus]|uniref:Paraquat-inducible protein B n=1 Tax=Primorskyibacter flagellatus TaxID=1387277 RepID=A0A917E8V7_9RHOB|nr:MlaD family protein [Primorskyibacter flagellatus]GGE16045.1 paraquat-inducible protein B [Primorskyibacter flagellatus]